MQNRSNSFVHSSGQLVLNSYGHPAHVVAQYLDLKKIDADEYLHFLKLTGDFLVAVRSGRLLADFSQLENFSGELRAIAINNFRRLIADRIPYLLLAIVKPKGMRLDITLDMAVAIAKPLSRKFLDGQIFSSKKEALSWLLEYPVSIR